MSETLLALVSDYGLVTLFLSAFLSCLLVPIPTAFVMLAGGAFAAAGDLAVWQVFGAAYAGAVLGDQTGFQLGRAFGPAIAGLSARRRKSEAAYARARQVITRYGGLGVFFSTWLFAPIGPWANIAAGAGGLSALRFTLWDAAGEAIWVGGYTALGFVFASDIAALAELLSAWAGFLAAGAVAVGLGYLLFERARTGANRLS